ncbi:MAG: WG repeat-containing protein [Clostridia bacterium]|nr:WG repeat-containing protein [Clostridia bacterium]
MHTSCQYYDPPVTLGNEAVMYAGAPLESGLYPFRTADGRWGAADAQGVKVEAVYGMLRPLREQEERFLVALRDGRWGLMDEDAALILPCLYDEIVFVREGLFAVRSGSGWGFMRYEGGACAPATEMLYEDWVLIDTDDGDVIFVRQAMYWGTMGPGGSGMYYARWGLLDGACRTLVRTRMPYKPSTPSGNRSRKYGAQDVTIHLPEGDFEVVVDRRMTDALREGAYL